MLEQTSEHEDSLVIQAKQGDRNAFGELVVRYYEHVIRVVYRLCGDAQIAQDAAQEAFIRAWIKLPGYQPRAPFAIGCTASLSTLLWISCAKNRMKASKQ